MSAFIAKILLRLHVEYIKVQRMKGGFSNSPIELEMFPSTCTSYIVKKKQNANEIESLLQF